MLGRRCVEGGYGGDDGVAAAAADPGAGEPRARNPPDPRLILRIAPAVAQAAMDSGVATLPIADMDAYRARLGRMLAGHAPNP